MNKKIDNYGFIKLIMAVMIAVMHYNILVWHLPSMETVGGDGLFGGILRIAVWICLAYGSAMTDCFFVLSGMFFCKGYLNKVICGEIEFKVYFVRRVRRLYPLMIISVIMMTVLQWIWFYAEGDWWTGRPATLWDSVIAMSGFSVGAVFHSVDHVNGPIWYISVLMIDYIVFYLICRYLIKKEDDKRYIFLLLPILLGFAIDSYGINLPFLTTENARGYVGFFVGVVFEIIYIRLSDKSKRLCRMVSFGILLLISIVFIIFKSSSLYIFDHACFLMSVLIFPSFIMLYEPLKHLRIFENKFNDFLGQISFPIFLLHIPCFLLFDVLKRFAFADISDRVTNLVMIVTIFVLSAIWIIIENLKGKGIHSDSCSGYGK